MEKKERKKDLYNVRGSTLLADCERMRQRLQEMQRIKDKELYDKQEAIRKQQELEKLRKLEREKADIEHRTKEYFYFDHYNRKKAVESKMVFFGDIEEKNTAWRPQGKGKVTENGEVIAEGTYEHGDFKQGKLVFKNALQNFEGKLNSNQLIDGNGTIAKRIYHKEDVFNPDLHNGEGGMETKIRLEILPGDEILSKNGQIICYKHELQIGRQIEFLTNIYDIYDPNNDPIRAYVVKHIKQWKFLLRFQNEISPKNRIIDLNCVPFKLLRHLPLIYDISLDNQGELDANCVYDYRFHLTNKTQRKLIENFPKKNFFDKKDNYFESQMIGIGAAELEEQAKEKERLKKLQWKLLIEEKKKLFLEKQKLEIENQQKLNLENSVKEQAEKKLQEKENEEMMHKQAVEQTLHDFDEKYANIAED